MRDIGTTLTAEQKKESYKGLAKIVLTLTGSTTQTYTASRILDIKYNEEPYSQTAEVLLDNKDGTLTDIDFKGYKGIISGGAVTSGGEEYSPKPPLWVIGQQLLSWQGRLACMLSLTGVPNFLNSEGASAVYAPDSDDTDTVETILTAIAEATLACYNHAHAFIITVTRDALINVFQPKDGFRISKNESRLSAMKRLLSYTKCVMRVEDDGEIHVFEPTTTGSTYNYTYELGKGNHIFKSLSHRKRLVIPYYVQVDSHPSHGDGFTGYAEDTAAAALVAIDSTIGQREYRELRLVDDTQAGDIAAAILSHYQLEAERGSALVPMNFGGEVYDYVNCIDSRDGDNNRTGNIGYIQTHYSPGRFDMTFGFGKVGFGLAGTAIPQLSSTTGVGGLTWSQIMPVLQDMMSVINGILAYLETLEGLDLAGYIWVDASGNIHIRPKSGLDIIAYEDIDPKTDDDASLGSTTKKILEGHFDKIYSTTRTKIAVGTDMYD